jgi:hypothetical protein
MTIHKSRAGKILCLSHMAMITRVWLAMVVICILKKLTLGEHLSGILLPTTHWPS